MLGAAAAPVTDAVGHLLSAALLRTLPRAAAARPAPGAASSVAAQIGEGRRYVTRHPMVGPCLAMAASVNFACGALMTPTPVFLIRTLGAPPGVVGVLTATEGLGSPLGAALTPRPNSRFGSARALLVAPVVGAAPALLMPPATDGAGLVLFALGDAGFAPPPRCGAPAPHSGRPAR
ncbi:hypothetical protein [Kitasatospora griseola]